jgi:hypothetical protein
MHFLDRQHHHAIICVLRKEWRQSVLFCLNTLTSRFTWILFTRFWNYVVVVVTTFVFYLRRPLLGITRFEEEGEVFENLNLTSGTSEDGELTISEGVRLSLISSP